MISSLLMSKGRFRTIRRFARLGAILGLGWGIAEEDEAETWVEVDAMGFWRLSTRFFRVAEIIEPLKIWA